MNSPVFDTHKAVKHLTKAGADEPLAEAVVTTIGIAMSEHMATKADLKSLEQDPATHLDGVADRLIARLDLLERRLIARLDLLEQTLNARMDGVKADLKSLERRMTIRLGGLIVVGFAVLAALIKL